MPCRTLLLLPGVLLGCAILTEAVRADDSPGSDSAARAALHGEVDRLIDATSVGVPRAEQADDAEFLRRVYLDLAGRIPKVDEARTFLDDQSADKREQLIDRLLDGPDYPRRMAEYFHVMLMERRGDNDDWNRFLRTVFEQNQPWDRIARALIKPDPDSETERGAAYFMTQRLISRGAMAPIDVPGLTRDVGRLLAGVDLQCAECHDHLTITHYLQQDFQGLHMVFENVKTRGDVTFPAVSEGVMTSGKEFKSVFEQVALTTVPRVPGGATIDIPSSEKDQEYLTPPDRKTKFPGIPRFSPLQELANGLTSPANDLFCRNITNRLWFMMMGRGLVEPLDLHHADNPPSHPELLDLLARQFANEQFNIRWLLRELALTRTYQRGSVLPADASNVAPDSYAVALEKRVLGEQLFWSVGIATGEFDAVRLELMANGQPAESHRSLDELVRISKPLQTLQKDMRDTFSNPEKEAEVEFAPSVRGALFLQHDERVVSLLRPRAGNLMDRLSQLSDDNAVIDELFLSVLSRRPGDDERKQLLELIGPAEESRMQVVANVMWALLTSTEFVVNH